MAKRLPVSPAHLGARLDCLRQAQAPSMSRGSSPKSKTRRSTGRPQHLALSLPRHASRITRHVFGQRCENEAGGIFQHPSRRHEL